MKMRNILSAALFLLIPAASYAWVYPEHRDITVLTVLKLDPVHRAILDQLWAQARTGYETRLNPAVVDPVQGPGLKYLDYGAWPAIAGDHSTSSANMVHNILETDWIMNVANVGALLKEGLNSAKNHTERTSAMRDADLRLLRVDPEYVSRAGSNNVHFMLARPDVGTTGTDYYRYCIREGAEPNLVATYAWYHTSALEKAGMLAADTLTEEERCALALAILADEAFAIHFLEDAFSAGHVAGIWGNAALRKGTHDYYDEFGLEVGSWEGKRMVLTGDAFMRPEDADRASGTILLSLVQVLDASTHTISGGPGKKYASPVTPDTLNVAQAVKMPGRDYGEDLKEYFAQVMIAIPAPGLATGVGELPRFRAEIGPFLGIAPATSLQALGGGFSPTQQTIGVTPRIEFAVHVGLGLEGVLNESGDGLVFLDLGFRLDGASSTKLRHDPAYGQFGSILSAVPSREAFYFRFRMPFYVVPGDLLLVAPILLLAAPEKFNAMMTTAGNGGVVPWQTGLLTPIGRFQFVLGREIGVCFYGWITGPDSFLVPDDRPENASFSLITMRTTQLDFPILEYRPFRSFSRTQSASLLIQISAGVDIPVKVTMIEPTDLSPVKVHPIWMAGIRLGFDWRYYVANK